ncbi:hypothetical protein ALC57_03562 [Trachymyrmex cornetzi]|uniref:Uncharacterized protein n=1 Tax=Trachymyrmex cornetzi TaxID=471704 RepID=A0A195EG54_9HYME|nr:hypothetical protein ALC57_03562 [Trachymyrmex cornetzi]
MSARRIGAWWEILVAASLLTRGSICKVSRAIFTLSHDALQLLNYCVIEDSLINLGFFS